MVSFHKISINDLGGLCWHLFTKYQSMTWVDCVGIFSQNINTNLQNYHHQRKPLNKWYLEHIIHVYNGIRPIYHRHSYPIQMILVGIGSKIYEPLMTTNPLPLITSSNLVYVVARLVVKVDDVSVTKTICSERFLCENCTNCENEFDSEFETDDEDEGHVD